jgi:hypothetical protein
VSHYDHVEGIPQQADTSRFLKSFGVSRFKTVQTLAFSRVRRTFFAICSDNT